MHLIEILLMTLAKIIISFLIGWKLFDVVFSIYHKTKIKKQSKMNTVTIYSNKTKKVWILFLKGKEIIKAKIQVNSDTSGCITVTVDQMKLTLLVPSELLNIKMPLAFELSPWPTIANVITSDNFNKYTIFLDKKCSWPCTLDRGINMIAYEFGNFKNIYDNTIRTKEN